MRAWLGQTSFTLGMALAAAGLLQAGARAAERAGVALPHPVALAMQTRPAPPRQIETLVWSGADVDGDGAPDFANPTGEAPRQHDAYGEGRFGASRDGGERDHEGVDFVDQPGQKVVAPISGYVTKIGYAYAGDSELKFVEISNPALGYVARAFYVDPSVEVGQAVRLGAPIGKAHTLQAKYPGGMTNHVHLELQGPDHARFDATKVITARLVTRTAAG